MTDKKQNDNKYNEYEEYKFTVGDYAFIIAIFILFLVMALIPEIEEVDNFKNKEIVEELTPKSLDDLEPISYNSKKINGVYNTKKIKSLSTQSNVNGNINGFKIGFLGTIDGNLNTETSYYTYVEKETGYLLEKYNVDNTFINETDNDEPNISQTYSFMLIDENYVEYLKDRESKLISTLKTSKVKLDGKPVNSYKEELLINSQTHYRKINKSTLSRFQKDLLLKAYPDLMNEEKTLYARSLDEYTLNVPVGTIMEEYKVN